jgi:hypothetical protein
MPLTPQQSLEDVSHEHARKTVTIDGHPHTGVPSVSIHPCRHGAVMKRIADQMADGGAEPLLEHYLFLFLRFCATAVPTIEYDYTGALPMPCVPARMLTKLPARCSFGGPRGRAVGLASPGHTHQVNATRHVTRNHRLSSS